MLKEGPPKIEKLELEPELIKEAEKLYSSKLAYHNFEHALRTKRYAKTIIKICLENAIPVNQQLVFDAILFHDAGYIEDSKKIGFNTQEEYSAFLANEPLKSFNRTEEQIKKVQRSIICTTKDVRPESTEEKIVRAADLTGMAKDYEVFVKDNLNLKNEAEMLLGEKIPMKKWKKSTQKIVGSYLSENICIQKNDTKKVIELFDYKKANENLDRFLKDDSLEELS